MTSLILDVAGPVNYYQNVSGILQLGVVGFAPAQPFSFKIEVISYTGSAQVGYDVYFRRPTPDEQNCFHWSGITPSGAATTTLNVTFAGPGEGVEWTGTSNATGCLDFTRLVFVARNFDYPGTWDLHARITITFQAPGALTYCEYGTEPTTLGEAVVWFDQALADAITFRFGGWLQPFIGPAVGSVFDINRICGDRPPTWQDLQPTDVLDALLTPQKIVTTLLWWLKCKCKDGPSSPVPPPAPTPVQPPGTVQPPIISFDPANPCQSLEPVLKMLQQLQRSVAKDYELDTIVQRYSLPFGVIVGAKHTGLTGTGSFPVGQLVGFDVEITSIGPDLPTWPGNPTYIKDQGWMSVGDQGAMLIERRITRRLERWLPQHCAMADRFNYFLPAGVTLNVTELEAEP